jgi:Na+/H+-dicarboxylate symporter
LALYFILLVIIDFAKVNPIKIFKAIAPAQLLFSTSSSAATLPVTMECVTENVELMKKYPVLLPLGATVNMDGTSLYQAVAAILLQAMLPNFRLKYAQ